MGIGTRREKLAEKVARDMRNRPHTQETLWRADKRDRLWMGYVMIHNCVRVHVVVATLHAP